jgi:hypothetical protein
MVVPALQGAKFRKYAQVPLSDETCAIASLLQQRRQSRIREKQVLTPLGFAIKNASSSPAEEVHVVLSINVEEGLIVRDAQDAPETPSTVFVPKIRGALVERGPTVHVERFGKTYEIEAEVGTIHPRTVRWSVEKFYIGATRRLTTIVRVTVSANNLRIPMVLEAEFDIEVETLDLAANQIVRFAKKLDKSVDAIQYSRPAPRSRD